MGSAASLLGIGHVLPSACRNTKAVEAFPSALVEQKCVLTHLLLPQCLGAENPIILWISVTEGRLKLQTTCCDAHCAVRRLAKAECRKLTHAGIFDLQLACAAGETNMMWAWGLPDGADKAQASQSSSLLLCALAGKRKLLAQLLESRGAELPQPAPPSPKCVTEYNVLAAASQGNLDKLLWVLAGGLDVNTSFTFGWTLLMSAACGNQPHVVRILLACGANSNAVNSAGHHAAQLACLNGHDEVSKILKIKHSGKT